MSALEYQVTGWLVVWYLCGAVLALCALYVWACWYDSRARRRGAVLVARVRSYTGRSA